MWGLSPQEWEDLKRDQREYNTRKLKIIDEMMVKMDKEEYIAWENKKSDLSIKIGAFFASEKLKAAESLSVLMHATTTSFISIKLQFGEKAANELCDLYIEDLKEEFKAKMEHFKNHNDMNDVLAEVMFHQVMKGKNGK